MVFLLRKTFAKPSLLPPLNRRYYRCYYRCKTVANTVGKTRAKPALIRCYCTAFPGVPGKPVFFRFRPLSRPGRVIPRKEGKRPLWAFLLVGVEVPGKTKENRPGVPSSWASIRRRSIFVLSLLFVLVSRLLFRADYPHQIGVDLGKTLFHASAVKLAWYAFIHPHPKYCGYGSGANLGG